VQPGDTVFGSFPFLDSFHMHPPFPEILFDMFFSIDCARKKQAFLGGFGAKCNRDDGKKQWPLQSACEKNHKLTCPRRTLTLIWASAVFFQASELCKRKARLDTIPR
jgi:hypothetical protein